MLRQLKPKDIDIWLWNLDSASGCLSSLERLLSAAERQRAGAFRFSRHQRRYILGRGMLRYLLGLYSELAPETISIGTSVTGKPYVNEKIGGLNFGFNVTHSEHLIAFAFALETRIGIDVELKTRVGEIAGVVNLFLSSTEKAELRRLLPERRLSALLRAWTSKEALLKAEGIGIANDLKSVGLSGDFCPRIVSLPKAMGRPSGWSLYANENEEAVMAIAIRGSGWMVNQRFFTSLEGRYGRGLTCPGIFGPFITRERLPG